MRKSQTNVLSHSQAKLDLYQKYLEKYFSILGLAKGVSKVNIYDLFSGTGIYENGKAGSPILAFEKVKENRIFFNEMNWTLKPIKLTINDVDESKVKIVKEYLELLNTPEICELKYYSSDTVQLFPSIITELSAQARTERNLLFIDPYGYKTIDPINIRRLLDNLRTEIILFLPISFMHRFKNTSLVEEKSCYQALNDFITKLFPEGHQMLVPENLSIDKFIQYTTEAFSFNNKYYCANHTIERSKGNLFAVFFITSHIYGLERMLTVKWDEDKEFGQGHRIKPDQVSLFEQEEKQEIQNHNYESLSNELNAFIKKKEKITNLELYEFTLRKNFLPKHSNQILNNWKKEKAIVILDALTNIQIDKPRTFYNKWDDYKTKIPKIIIKLK